MKVNINKITENELNLSIEYSKNIDLDDLVKYISKFDEQKVIVLHDNELIQINLDDIILFYSDKKYNYCRTLQGNFKVKNALYELEKMSNDFIRISKSQIININHVISFDMNETAKIVVKLDDNTNEVISRRRVRDVLNYLDEKGI